jgi:hypothetical protein
MRNAIFSLVLMLLTVGCTKQRAGHSEPEQRAASERNKAAAMAPATPEFSVSVRLSDAANKKLVESKETIIVAGYFAGHPKQGTERRYLDIKSGEVDLGDVEAEIHPGETAAFNDLKLNPDALEVSSIRTGQTFSSVLSRGENRQRTTCWIASTTTAG